MLQKIEGVGACGTAEDAEHLVVAAIIGRRILIDAKSNLADVQLAAIAWSWTLVGSLGARGTHARRSRAIGELDV